MFRDPAAGSGGSEQGTAQGCFLLNTHTAHDGMNQPLEVPNLPLTTGV